MRYEVMFIHHKVVRSSNVQVPNQKILGRNEDEKQANRYSSDSRPPLKHVQSSFSIANIYA